MKNDPSSVLFQMVDGLVDKRLSEVRVGIPCRVISFDTAACTADVQPLIRTSDSDPALIHSVPVLGQRLAAVGSSGAANADSADSAEEIVYKPVLHAGDSVFVVCADRELNNARTGKVSAPDTGRRHNVNDAVIVGVFPWSL